MRLDISKTRFDWSKEQNLRIKNRGTMALFNQMARVLPNLSVSKASTRSEWPLGQFKEGSRYLTRKIIIG